MSTAAVFEFHSDVSAAEIAKRVRAFWEDSLGAAYQSEVSTDDTARHTVDLCWFFGDAREEEQARLIIDYLLSISRGQRLHYLRDPTFDPGDSDFPRDLRAAEVFLPEFRPTMNANVRYRYVIRQ